MNQITHDIVRWLSLMCITVSLFGCAYALVAAFLVRRFFNRPAEEPSEQPGLTILKPLHGAEPDLAANLRSFCEQDYAGPVQVIFGVQNPKDAAIATVREIIAAYPQRNLRLIIDERMHGANRKVSNLINMAQQIEHDIVVLADSDMRVEPNYLRRVVAGLEKPGVGLVTCLYRGHGATGFWSRLSALGIDSHFLPSVVVGMHFGLARPCFGSTIALSRQTLIRIGGFEAFADKLADDYAMGDAVRKLGLRVEMPPFAVRHCCDDRSLSEMFRHELRWGRTISLVDPLGYAGSGVTHAVPIALLGAALRGFDLLGITFVLAALACRTYLQLEVSRRMRLQFSRIWLVFLRDLLSFVVYLTCFATNKVDWRGQRYSVKSDGRIVATATRSHSRVES